MDTRRTLALQQAVTDVEQAEITSDRAFVLWGDALDRLSGLLDSDVVAPVPVLP